MVSRIWVNKIYDPKLYKVSAESAQVYSHCDAPPPPPGSIEGYSKKVKERNGIIVMVDALIKGLDNN